MNTQHRFTDTNRDIDCHRVMLHADIAAARNRYAEEEKAMNARHDRTRESFLCVVSFIAIMVLACIL